MVNLKNWDKLKSVPINHDFLEDALKVRIRVFQKGYQPTEKEQRMISRLVFLLEDSEVTCGYEVSLEDYKLLQSLL